jgi:D-alanyl-D-alanine carboxypeptidase
MRIASIAKAFNGAVALHLVQEGLLGLNDTLGERLPGMMPPDWSAVTVREMLNHTSGLPDYTQSAAFREQAMTNPRGYVSPTGIIDWVRNDRLVFRPGSRYQYSNSGNIVVGLIAQPVARRILRRPALNAWRRVDLSRHHRRDRPRSSAGRGRPRSRGGAIRRSPSWLSF